jgi:predicted esterase
MESNASVLTAGAPLEGAGAAVVLVHGRNASARDILSLTPELERPGVALLAPSANGGTWYPYSFMADIAANEPWLSTALDSIGRVVRAVEAHVPLERIVLLGFSQGGCLCSEFAVRNAARYGGLLAFSAGLIGPPGTTWDHPGSFDGMTAFFGCSDVDPHIPLDRVDESVEVLRRMNALVTRRIYPRMGHFVNEDEIAFARDLIDSLIG